MMLAALLLVLGVALALFYFAYWNSYDHLSIIREYIGDLETDVIGLYTYIGFGITAFFSIIAYLLTMDSKRAKRPSTLLYLCFLNLSIQAAALLGALLENAVTAVISIPAALVIAFASPFLIFSFEALLFKIFGGLGFFGMRMKWYRAASFFIHKALLLKPADPQLIEAQGQCLHRSGRLSSARAVLIPLMKAIPLSDDSLYLLAEGFEKSGRPEEAISFYQDLQTRHPDDLSLSLRLSDLYLKTEQVDLAIPLIEARTDFNSLDEILRLERLYLKAGNTSRVRELLAQAARVEEAPCAKTLFEYRRILQASPDDAQLLRDIGDLCWELGKKGEGAEYYERLLSLESDNKDLRRMLLQYHLETLNVAMVEKHIEHLLRQGEMSPLILKEYAQLLIQKENYEGAIEHLNKARERYPEEYQFPQLLAQLYYDHKEYDRAREELAEAIKIAPQEKKDELQILARKIEGAIVNAQIKDLRDKIDADPKNTKLRYDLIERLMVNSYFERVTSEIDTFLYFHPEMKEEIRAFIENLASRYEQNFLLLDYLADMCLKDKELDKALAIYERASSRVLEPRSVMKSCCEKIFRIDPDYLPAHKKFGELALEEKDWETLVRHWRICFERNEELIADRLDIFFDALCAVGNQAEALIAGQRMIARSPENPKLLTKLGKLYLDCKRFPDAMELFDKAKALAPADKDNIKLLEKALSSEKKRKLDEAIQRLEAEPDNSELREEAGDLLCFFEDFTEAVKHYQRAAQLAPQPDICKAKLAYCLARRGMLDLAEETLGEIKLSLSDNPHQEEIKSYFLDTAIQFEKELEHQKALKLYKQIFRVDAGFKDVVARIEKIENLGMTVTPYGKKIRGR